ncbi:MAG TPA: hypothetical protein VFU21_32755 [Kofleriaceae bacterium]|nr:hypothetical protein [Kofleriaceae bacterium]
MTLSAAPCSALLVAGLLAAGCGGAAVEAGGQQNHEAAFRSIGPSRLPQPPPPPEARTIGSRTQRYASGRPRSLGAYTVYQQRSVPHGVWTFWAADGSRTGQGRFHLGSPVGCFAIWSHGHRVTGIADGEQLRPADCQTPLHEEADILESTHGGGAQPPVDLSFETYLAPGAGIGATSTRFENNDPDMIWAVSSMWRRRVKMFRYGAALGVRAAEDEYFAVPVALVGGWGRQLRTWLTFDVRGELGALVISTRPVVNSAFGHEWFWTPLGAVQADAGWQIAGRLEVTAGARLELGLPRDVERTARVCSFNCGTETDTWSLGGLTAGLVLGFRFLVW